MRRMRGICFGRGNKEIVGEIRKNYEKAYMEFGEDFGDSKKMVLSTSLNDIVTSRMMSVVAINEKLYFQTYNTFRKYDQLKGNHNVALCVEYLLQQYCGDKK